MDPVAPAAVPADADVLAGYRAASARVLAKELGALDRYCLEFVARSPFAVLATASPDGRPDVSPRGGAPGFVRALGPHRLALPDRIGNNRVDSLRNVVANPRAALMFFVPGFDETLRVYGTTRLVPAQSLDLDLTEFGRTPLSVLVLSVERAYFQCPKSVMRSGLWDPAQRVDRSTFPPFGEVMREHCRDDGIPADDAVLRAELAAEL